MEINCNYKFRLWLQKEGAAGAAGAAGACAPQEVEVDIDELLDMDSDELRRRHLTVRHCLAASRRPSLCALLHAYYFLLQTLLADAKKPQKDVHVSIYMSLIRWLNRRTCHSHDLKA